MNAKIGTIQYFSLERVLMPRSDFSTSPALIGTYVLRPISDPVS